MSAPTRTPTRVRGSWRVWVRRVFAVPSPLAWAVAVVVVFVLIPVLVQATGLRFGGTP